MPLHITTNRFLYKKYNQLFDMAYADNFILPVGEVGETKSMYNDEVLGGDVWDLLDELMIYMGNPMQYHEKDTGCPFVRTPRNRQYPLCSDTSNREWVAFCFCFWCRIHR